MKTNNWARLCYLSVLILCVSLVGNFWHPIVRTAKALPGEVQGSLVSGVFILLTAYLAYFYGLRTYFRQREHGLIVNRYLVNGIDRLLTLMDALSRVFIHNYTEASNILLRLEAGLPVDPSVEFWPVRNYPDLTPLFKLGYVVGYDTPMLYAQDMYIFVEAFIAYLKDFRRIVSDAEDGLQFRQGAEPSSELRMRLAETFRGPLDEYYKTFLEYGSLNGELHTIASILEKDTDLTWADLAKFRDRSEVKQSVEKMNKSLAQLRERRRSQRKTQS